MVKFIEKIKKSEIVIYEYFVWSSLVSTLFYISYIGIDEFENNIYNLVENIFS